MIGPELLALVSEASHAVTRFDAHLGNEIAPFAAILLRSESASSSQIENLSSGARQIALAELGSREKRNATEIVGNVAAMRAALSLADRLDTSAVLAMHRALMESHAPDIAGHWRTDQVWIGGSNIGPHDADYVAPPAAAVPGLMDDLITFAHREDLPPLAAAALAHAQFETIHPFPDGNGRTGRALIQAMLRTRDITRNVTVPVSAGLLTDTRRYFEALNSYRGGDVSPIIESISHASLDAVASGTRLVSALHQLRTRWEDRLSLRRDASSWRLLDVLLRQPVVDGRAAAEALGITPANVGRAISPLVDARILREFTGFDRNRMWCATEVTDILDEFARSAERGSLPHIEP
ncbi:Fic family protein [Gordonia caeni]|uniref:Fic family protein n=1 Tax=Gordonia caeni TaxID=1007097 RepID=A0ABP7PGE5_9ACTN